MIDDQPPPAITAGLLVLVVGASGVGKDSLLAIARKHLSGDGAYIFPRRTITRAMDATEDHEAISEAEFERLSSEGHFALSWKAHGLHYGVACGIDEATKAGRTVVFNVSRTVIAEAHRRYPRVLVIEILADKVVRAARLAGRGREPAEEIAARLSHTPETDGPTLADVLIDNNGRLEDAAVRFIGALRSQTS